MLDLIFNIALLVILIIGLIVTLIPIGNEHSTLRRLPWVTFSIIGINVIIFFLTLPATSQQARELERTRKELDRFLLDNDGIEKDPIIRRQLRDAGVLTKKDADEIERQLEADPQDRHDWDLWLKGSEASTVRKQCETLLGDY